MLSNAFPALIQNAALLLAMAFVYDLTTSRFRLKKPTLPVQLAIGATLGILSIIIMLSSWRYVTGIVFDTRSVLLGVAGLFFGVVPTVVAIAMAAAFRLSLGGAATVTGVSVILASGTLGLLWRHYRRPATEDFSWRELYLFGVLVHAVMLALMFLLPWATALEVLAQISLPVLLIYPLATAMLGSLMVLRHRRERIATELQTSEERMRLFFERQIVGMAITSPQKGWVQVNDELCRMLGYSREELFGSTWAELTHPDDLQPDLEQFERLLTGAIDEYSMEKRFIRKDGSVVWTELSVGCVRFANGTVDFILALLIDITERKQAEEELRESEARFRLFFEKAPAPYQSLNAEGRILEVNEAWLTMTGYRQEEVIGHSIAEFITPASLPLLKERFPAFLQTGAVHNAEFDYVGKNGTIITMVVEGRIGYHRNGTFKQTHCVLHNITERKQAEAALRESEERYRTLVNNLPGLAYRCLNDEHWTMLFFSEEIERMTGYPAADFINNAVRSFASIIHPDDGAMVDRAVQAGVVAHQPYEMEYRLIRADGVTIWVHEKGQGIYGPDGELVWLDGVIIDISRHIQAEEEQRHLQAQLLQSQKMELVGRLAGGVAHDFNNMLQTILGYSELSLAKVEATSPVHEELLEIRKAAMRSADLTRQLLAFARKQTANPKVLDLNDTVAGMLKMLQRLIGEDIDLAWLPGHSLWPVKIDPSQLDQILANLTVNARDAIADTGKITIETENISLNAAYCTDHPEALPGAYVLLVVSDNGCGMDTATLAHIFEPFFTTKEQGKGTGLGLATVYGIVKQNNGFVNVYSEPGQGTTFSIYLPSFASETVIAETSRAEEPAGGTETVLLVEDDGAILNLGKTMLQRLGYAVLAANTPMMAIQLAQEHAGEIHLLITDVVMPEMNGRELVQRLSALRPGMQCLYMSGYTANVIAHHGVLDPGIHFIQKPFSMGDLAHAIQKTLRDRKENP